MKSFFSVQRKFGKRCVRVRVRRARWQQQSSNENNNKNNNKNNRKKKIKSTTFIGPSSSSRHFEEVCREMCACASVHVYGCVFVCFCPIQKFLLDHKHIRVLLLCVCVCVRAEQPSFLRFNTATTTATSFSSCFLFIFATHTHFAVIYVTSVCVLNEVLLLLCSAAHSAFFPSKSKM